MSEPRTVVEAVVISAMLFAGVLFWHLQARLLASPADDARTPPPQPQPMAGGMPVLLLGQHAVAPDRRWLLIPRGA
jgi:hypothetical protein